MNFYFLRKKITSSSKLGSCCDQKKMSSLLAVHAAGHWISRQLSCQQILVTCDEESSTVVLYDLLMI
jgi:hypothetical protein